MIFITLLHSFLNQLLHGSLKCSISHFYVPCSVFCKPWHILLVFQGLSWNASIDVHGSMNLLCMPVSGKVVNIIHHRGGGHPSLFSIVLCSDPFLNFSERNQSGHETRLFHQSSSANTFNATVKTAFPLHHWHTTKSILNCKAVVCVCVCGGGGGYYVCKQLLQKDVQNLLPIMEEKTAVRL